MTEEQPPQVRVENAENVNVPAAEPEHPLVLWIVAGVTAGVLIGFGLVTLAVLSGEAGAGIDAATKGSIIQTWNNLAVAAASVWTASKAVERLRGAK